jgi:flagellar FliL protein
MSSKKSKDEELRATPPADEKGGKDGAEGGEGAEGEGGEGKKGPNAKKIILFAVIPIFLLGGVGAGLYFTGMLDKFIGKKPAVEGEAEAGKEGETGAHGKKAEVKLDEHGNPIGAYFLQIPDMLVNLSAESGQNRYLRLSVQLELSSEEDKKAVEAVMPRVVDQFQTYLRELRVKDLRGSAGIYRLQMELLNRVNAAAAPVEVEDVLFQEILIQ